MSAILECAKCGNDQFIILLLDSGVEIECTACDEVCEVWEDTD
jgi:hypothetical protein